MSRYILQKILAALARAAIKKYSPIIVGITGSVGKTSAREAIFAALKKKYRVRTAEKNYNNEIGFPLAILGINHYGRNVFKWLSAFVRVLWRLSASARDRYPEILVLEYGIDRPGDMDYLLSIAKPLIAVVCAIGDVPVHVEFFKDPEEVIAEKRKLVAALSKDGWAVLNRDDNAVYEMAEKISAHTLTFGFEEHSKIKIINYQLSIFKDEKLGDIPDGISFKIEYSGHLVPFWIFGGFGKPQAYAGAAAAAVGMALDLNLVEISEALRSYISPPGRMRLLHGIKNSFILDDTYNAAPEAMRSALDTLKSLPGKRKIATLGDMLEIGRYAEEVHRAIGVQAAGFIDLLITVGPRAKFIAEETITRGIKTMKFDDPESAGKALDPLIQPGDLVLVKGSQSMRMEKAVREIMAQPEKAEELLVRQDEYWLKR